MAVQVSRDNTNKPFVLLASPGQRQTNQTLLQDAGRTTDLAPFTLMAKVAATQKWVPFTSATAVDGTAIPQGIYAGGAIATADIVAGDVTGLEIWVGDLNFDSNQLVIENSLTLDTTIASSNAAAVYQVVTVRDYLAWRSMFAEDTILISNFENT